MDLYKYRRRLKKATAMEGMEENTKIIVNQTFHESPNYSNEIFLNGIKFDGRISVEEDETKLEVLFRPETELNKGDIIEIDGTHWLTINTYKNDIFPTAFAEFCNEWLRWEKDNGEYVVYPCVVKGKTYDLNEGKYLVFSENTIIIQTPYNEDTKKITTLQRFILNEKPYSIDGIDLISNVSFGKGFIEMKATQTLLEAEDNLDEQIADNKGSGWGEW